MNWRRFFRPGRMPKEPEPPIPTGRVFDERELISQFVNGRMSVMPGRSIHISPLHLEQEPRPYGEGPEVVAFRTAVARDQSRISVVGKTNFPFAAAEVRVVDRWDAPRDPASQPLLWRKCQRKVPQELRTVIFTASLDARSLHEMPGASDRMRIKLFAQEASGAWTE